MPRVHVDLRRALDLEAIEHGQTLWTYRCYAGVRFRQSMDWSSEQSAILDTGAPFSILPSTLWQRLRVTPLFPTRLRGIIPHTSASLPARLAKVACVLTDERGVSPTLELAALLVEAPDVPLVLGWAGCLDRARLVLDTPKDLAWLEF